MVDSGQSEREREKRKRRNNGENEGTKGLKVEGRRGEREGLRVR